MVAEQLEDVLRAIVADDESRAQLQAVDTVVRLTLTDPDGQVTIRGKAGADVAIDVGDTPFDPEVTLVMGAPTAEALLAGTLDVVTALANGEIRAKGPVPKVLRLVPVLMGAAGRVAPVSATASPQATGDEPAPDGEGDAPVGAPPEPAEIEGAPGEEPAAQDPEVAEPASDDPPPAAS